MWKPVLSAANHVRRFFIPPKARTAMCPSGSRFHGHPHRSNCNNSWGASLTKASTASWSLSQSPPDIVSYACSSRLSSGFATPAAPPSAETVWLRMGYTLDTTAMLSLGLTSAAAIAARSPAPPPPTRSTSCDEASMIPHGGCVRRVAALLPPKFAHCLLKGTRYANDFCPQQ